ncbi:Citron Rho-interacting kinase [Armadillidium nasatum]|uniref:non-specific serine/threonine protein kinase n=1 Tax=Armadillidium nasatum TaxID=96803 RepID=A0A5N5T965_9CRUS|nr:Citron Rho-interacting kinase [Armadillidium nasatum]
MVLHKTCQLYSGRLVSLSYNNRAILNFYCEIINCFDMSISSVLKLSFHEIILGTFISSSRVTTYSYKRIKIKILKRNNEKVKITYRYTSIMLDSSSEPIIQRLQKIDDAINSIGVSSTETSNAHRFLAKDGLLDALLVLYDECNNETLKRNKIIGKGHFGVVQVVREKQTGNVYALKILQKSETLAQQHVTFYEEERDIMAKATSPWITHLQYAFQDERNLYILMDFHPGGDLLSLLDRFNYVFTEEMTRFYLAEITVAIQALHTMGYVHRDIKPDNILIDRLGHIKLADFGSAAKLTSAKCVRSEMPVGTPDYIAPELLTSMNKTRNNDTPYGVECDFWSLGIMAYEMLYGETPFKGENALTTYSNIMNHEFQDSEENVVSEDAKDLIKGLLSCVQQRFCYNKIVNHKFFLHIDWNNLESVQPPFIPVVTSVDDTNTFHLEVELKSKKKELHDAHMKRLSESTQGKGFMTELEKKALRDEKKLSLLEEEVKNSRMETVAYVKKIESLKEALKTEKAARAEREAKALEYMKEVKEKWKKNEEEKLKHLVEKVEIYQKSAEALSEHKDEAEKQLRDMTLEANKLEEEVLKYKFLYKEKVNELRKMASERLSLNNEVNADADESANIELHKKCADDLDKEKKKVSQLETQVGTLNNEVVELKKDRDSIKSRVARERDLVLHELEVKLTHEQRECYELRIKLQELSQSLNESLATQGSVVSQQEYLETQLKSSQEELQAVTQEKENILHRLSAVSSREDEQRLKIKELESLLESLRKTLNKLELKQTNDNEKEIQYKSEAQLELLQKQLQNTQETASADKEKLHLAESKLFKNEKIELEKNKSEIEENLKRKDVDILVINRKFEESQSEIKRLLRKIEESEKDKEETKTTVEELKRKVFSCQSESDKMKRKGFENELKLLEKEIEVERGRNHDKESTQNALIKELETKLANANTVIDSLKEVCSEQDDQLSALEKFEEKLSLLSNEKQSLSSEIKKLQSELKMSKSSVNEEKSLRIFQEKRVKDLESKLVSNEQEMDEQKSNFEEELKIVKEENNVLNTLVSDLEKEKEELYSKGRSFELTQLESNNQIELLKEEISGHIQYIHSLKDSNFKLTEGLEEAITKGETYKKRIDELEKHLRDYKVIYGDKELKLNSTISQQTKLIDFLQAKVENPPKKKATLSRMFGSSNKNKENSGFMVGHQYRKLEDLLAREKEHTKQLASRLAKIQNENLTLKNHANPATTQSHRVMEDLTNSPLHEKQPRERMKHKIPHRWQSHLVVRPGRCIGCLGSVPFSRNGVKCNECGVIAHTKCSKNIANTCGLPDGFAHHYSQSRAKSNCDEQCSQDSTKILMKGWIKIPRSGKATWDKTYACLNERELCYYDQQPIPSLQPLKKFNLDTKNSRIAILHSVPMSELPSCNASDLPYVLKADESKDDYKGSLESHTLLSLNSVTSLDINTVVFLNSRVTHIYTIYIKNCENKI